MHLTNRRCCADPGPARGIVVAQLGWKRAQPEPNTLRVTFTRVCTSRSTAKPFEKVGRRLPLFIASKQRRHQGGYING